MLSSFHYHNCHTLITRPISGTSIDNVYTNILNPVFIDTIKCYLTDHHLLTCKLKTNFSTSESSQIVRNICNFTQAKNKLLDSLQLFEETGNPSTDTSEIVNLISNAINECTVEKIVKINTKQEITPWINKNLSALIGLKKKLLKLRKKRQSVYIEVTLKRLSRVIKKACKDSMNNYYFNKINTIQHDPRKCWKFLNENLGRKLKSEIRLTNAEGEDITDDLEKANLFNNYFIDIPKTLKQAIQYSPSDTCNGLRTLNSCDLTFNFAHTTIEEIDEFISKLEINKSSGHDGISSKMLIECKNILTPYLSNIFNRMIDTAIYPKILKLTKIIPIPKQTNSIQVDMFRPIALLPIIDKIFEKILCNQLTSYLDGNNFLYSYQYGFRKGCGTEEAVVNVVNGICQGLDDGFKGVAGIFYDFSKAFDLVEFNILLQKLKYYGIKQESIALLSSYLTQRKQFVELNKKRSSVSLVESGVPQGSVLGPLLFTIYLNDIMNLKLFGKLYLYADDICILYPYKHEVALKPHMEHDAILISEFVRINKLVLNPQKTRLLRFRPYIIGDENFSIFVDDNEIFETSSTKYLGVHINNNLSWYDHIQHLKSKIAPATGLLYKFKNKFDSKTKLLIYNSLIHSHLNYLPIIYGYKKSNELKSLQRLQNKALKVIFNLPLTFPTILLYRDKAKTVLPIHGLYKMHLLLHVYKTTHNIGHHTIWFTRNQTSFNTRNSTNLRVARCRLETTKQKIEYIGSFEFNNLPIQLKNIDSISLFKAKLKEFLFENLEMLL